MEDFWDPAQESPSSTARLREDNFSKRLFSRSRSLLRARLVEQFKEILQKVDNHSCAT